MDFDRMLRYCAALEIHNDRAWFHENHGQYEAARKDFIELLELTRFAIMDSAPALADDLMYSHPKDWMYRIARDMRYYKNQPPYIPAFRAYISADKKSWLPIGYYMRIGPHSSCFGTGLWCEDTASTNLARDAIMANWEEFGQALALCGVPLTGDALKRMPRGYPEGHPASEWVKLRNWTTVEDLPDASLTTFDDYTAMVRDRVRRMEPMRQFLLAAARGEKSRKRISDDFLNAQ